MPKAIAKMTISFSLVSIPVSLYAATERHVVPLHLVHAQDGGRIRQKRVCELDGTEVPFEDVAHGYEAPDGRMVVLTQDDLADLPLTTTKEIRVLGFLGADRVDPVNYDKAYYLGPSSPAGARPYALLRQAMLEADQVAVARVAIRTRECLAVLRVRQDVIVLQTLLWPDEIRSAAGIAPEGIQLRPKEVQLARTLMDAITSDFHIEAEHDEYAHALEQVVEARLAGLEPPHASESRVLPPGGTVMDLMAVLERALADAREQHPKTSGAVKTTGTTQQAGKKAPARRSTSTALPAGGDAHRKRPANRG
ncbi:non-homologous end joining protein Ku [Streptomyces kaniharaensis]|uniref:non-homologous end joining protein Ku n=1 Tax=Streptomyces kaniharaensis TaxID=212423 RepID=UPI001297AD48|nr:Ku protein [Streptomyces kaniharaensis]